MEQLKPCPFCGASPTQPEMPDWDVHCDNCGCFYLVQSGEDAVKLWNTRSIDAEVGALRKVVSCARQANDNWNEFEAEGGMAECMHYLDKAIAELDQLLQVRT